MWTKKHDEFCLSVGLRPSSKLLYGWINRKVKSHVVKEIEIDLRDFNHWVGKKRGKPYDRKTLKSAIAQLLEKTKGLIVEIKQITWYYYKLLVKPLSYLTSDKKPIAGKSPNSESPKSASDSNSHHNKFQQQQQNISKIDSLLQKLGLRYDFQALNKIWQLSGRCVNRIVKAIELMLYRHQSNAIPKPPGFIIECLKHTWQEGFDLYYQPELPKFNAISDLKQFMTSL